LLEREIDYRLAKWLLTNLKNQGVISDEEMRTACKEISEHLDSPFRELEDFDTGMEVVGNG